MTPRSATTITNDNNNVDSNSKRNGYDLTFLTLLDIDQWKQYTSSSTTDAVADGPSSLVSLFFGYSNDDIPMDCKKIVLASLEGSDNIENIIKGRYHDPYSESLIKLYGGNVLFRKNQQQQPAPSPNS